MHALLLAGITLFSPPAQSDDFAATWTKIEQAIATRYYAREERGDEMKRLFIKYRPIAQGAKSRAEFEQSVNAMIDEFKDSHFGYFTLDHQGYFLMDALLKRGGGDPVPMPHVGAWFRPGPDGYTVQMVLNNSEAERAGLRVGDLVTQADGQKFSPVGSLRSRDRVRLTVRRSGGELVKELKVATEPASDAFLQASKDSARVIEHNGRRIGYFRLWTMANDSFKNALHSAVAGKLANTDAFILDLRDGFGGRPEGFGDPFFRPEAELAWGMAGTEVKQPFGYQRPLIVLINQGSRSAKEVFSYVIQRNRRATLVGLKTGGNVLGTVPMRVNDWSILEIPMVTVKVDGVELEDRGVSPDVAVAREFDENGKDLVMERALELLKDVKRRSARG